MRRLAVPALVAVLCGACSGGSGTTTSLSETTTTTAGIPVATAPATTSTANTTTTTPTTIPTTTSPAEPIEDFVIIVEGGSVDKVETYEVLLADEVRLLFIADVTDEVHLHGYDLRTEVSPGSEGAIEFVADIPGVFEIELENAGVLIGELRVNP